MQENHDCKDDSQVFLCWAFSDNQDELKLDVEVTEDAKARKRRIQSELARALAVLGIKHSTFYSMLNKGRHQDVKVMLKKCLKERSEALLEEFEEEASKQQEFNIHLEYADMTTIHEAYQFLVKKYIDGNEDVTAEMFIDMEEIKAKHEEKMAKKKAKEKAEKELAKAATRNDKAGRDAGRKSRRNSFMSMTGLDIEEKDPQTAEAEKVASEMLDLPETKRRSSNRRRKSALLGINMDSDDEPDAGGSRSRRGSRRRRGKSGSRRSSSSSSESSSSDDEETHHKRRPSHRRRKSALLGVNNDSDDGESSQMDGHQKRSRRRKSKVLTPHDSGDEKAMELSVADEPLKRRGSRKYGKKKSNKDNNPYPQRKGSFRRFEDSIADTK